MFLKNHITFVLEATFKFRLIQYESFYFMALRYLVTADDIF